MSPELPSGGGDPGFRGAALSWGMRDEVLEVELHRAPCNEIGSRSLEELEALAALVRGGAGGARALLVHSTRAAGFCAGADLRELHAGLLARPEEAPARVRDFVERIHAVLDTFDTAPIPTVAAVHGVCFGGGLELALAADLRVADKGARFAFPELRLGLIPGFGGLPRLRREVGGGVILDLLLSGRSLGAARAHALGLVGQVVARGQALEAARRLARQTARFDREATAAAKAFAKRLPRAELEEEKRLFCELVTRPAVLAALGRFAESTDVRPYLP